MDGSMVGLAGGLAGGVVGVIGGIVGTYFSIKNTKGPTERAFAIRAATLVGLGSQRSWHAYSCCACTGVCCSGSFICRYCSGSYDGRMRAGKCQGGGHDPGRSAGPSSRWCVTIQRGNLCLSLNAGRKPIGRPEGVTRSSPSSGLMTLSFRTRVRHSFPGQGTAKDRPYTGHPSSRGLSLVRLNAEPTPDPPR